MTMLSNFFFLVIFAILVTTSAIEMSIEDLFVNGEDSEYESNMYKQLKELMDLDVIEVEKNIQEISEELRKQFEAISKKGNAIIPQTSLSKIIKNNGRIPETVARKVRKRGVLIVRHTIPSEEIHQWMSDLGERYDFLTWLPSIFSQKLCIQVF